MRTYLRMHDSGLNYLRRGNGGMVAAADLAAAVELAATAEMGVVSAAAICLLYTSPSPRDRQKSRMPSSA